MLVIDLTMLADLTLDLYRGIVRLLFGNLDVTGGVAVGCLILFIPTIIANLRKMEERSSVSALNVVSVLMAIGTMRAIWLIWPILAIWAGSLVWSIVGGRTEG